VVAGMNCYIGSYCLVNFDEQFRTPSLLTSTITNRDIAGMRDPAIAQYLRQLPVRNIDICSFRKAGKCNERNENDANEGEIMGNWMREN